MKGTFSHVFNLDKYLCFSVVDRKYLLSLQVLTQTVLDVFTSLSLQGCNTELTESRVILPENFLPHISVVACVGEEEYLYVFNAEGDCHRLDLTLNALEHIEKPKGPITSLKQVLVVKSSLFMVVDESLWVLDQTDLECMWSPAVESSFPSGVYAVLNDNIYTLGLEDQKVTRYATMTSSFEDIKDFACNELQSLISLVWFW